MSDELSANMDIIYPYKLSDTQELKYSLRSAAKNLKHNNAFIIGQDPGWLSSEAKLLIVPQIKSKYVNLCKNIELACLLPGVSDPFIIMNDDFFVMKETVKIPYLYRADIHADIERVARHGMWDWLDGFERIRNAGGERSYELHVPLVVHKQPMLEALERFGPTPVWRTAYAAVGGLHGYPYEDVKVKDMTTPAVGRFVSTNNRTFAHGQVGKDIRRMFPEPSRYEC